MGRQIEVALRCRDARQRLAEALRQRDQGKVPPRGIDALLIECSAALAACIPYRIAEHRGVNIAKGLAAEFVLFPLLVNEYGGDALLAELAWADGIRPAAPERRECETALERARREYVEHERAAEAATSKETDHWQRAYEALRQCVPTRIGERFDLAGQQKHRVLGLLGSDLGSGLEDEYFWFPILTHNFRGDAEAAEAAWALGMRPKGYQEHNLTRLLPF